MTLGPYDWAARQGGTINHRLALREMDAQIAELATGLNALEEGA